MTIKIRQARRMIWTTASTLLGLISTVYHGLSHCAEVLPNQLVMVNGKYTAVETN